MTVLNVRQARAIWLVDARDLNPYGIDIWPILSALRERYNFQTYPKSIEEANESDPKGITFANGSFAVGSSRHSIVKATMYSDGIVADSALSTDFSEAFLADVLSFLSAQFGFTYRPEMVHTKLYVSELIVRIPKDLNGLFSSLTAITEQIRLVAGRNFQPAGFGFTTDPADSNARAVAFRFEREVGKPFSQRRYFSSAPVRTSQHEDLLRQMESLL